MSMIPVKAGIMNAPQKSSNMIKVALMIAFSLTRVDARPKIIPPRANIPQIGTALWLV